LILLMGSLSLRNAYRLLHRGVETESSACHESMRQVQEEPRPGMPLFRFTTTNPGNVMRTQWLSSLPRVEKTLRASLAVASRTALGVNARILAWLCRADFLHRLPHHPTYIKNTPRSLLTLPHHLPSVSPRSYLTFAPNLPAPSPCHLNTPPPQTLQLANHGVTLEESAPPPRPEVLYEYHSQHPIQQICPRGHRPRGPNSQKTRALTVVVTLADIRIQATTPYLQPEFTTQTPNTNSFDPLNTPQSWGRKNRPSRVTSVDNATSQCHCPPTALRWSKSRPS
jgi:hypothetical protein